SRAQRERRMNVFNNGCGLLGAVTIAAGVCLAAAAPAQAVFVAYNDFSSHAGGETNATQGYTTGANVTHWSNGISTNPGTSGPLKDFATGANRPVILTVGHNGTSAGNAGVKNALSGSELGNIFNGIINLFGVLDYTAATGPSTLTWSGL